MPITEELNNIKKLESVGFSHEQAETLADVIEKAQVNGQESLKEFIRNELDSKINGLGNELGGEINNLRSEIKDIRNELVNEIKDLEIRLMYSQKDLLIKIFGIIVGTMGVAVTILKLFP